jgi:hypothetical protein
MIEATEQSESTLAEERRVLVLDVPFGTTSEEATQMIEEPFDRGFYIHRAMEWPGGARVIYIHRVKPEPKASAKPIVAVPTKEMQALQFLRDNREMSLKELAAAFKALGFPRSPAWIGKKLTEVIAADRRLGQATNGDTSDRGGVKC